MVITVKLNDKALIARLSFMPEKVKQSLERTLRRTALDLIEYIKREKLSADEGYSATLLHRISGALQRSIQYDVTSEATSVTARVFSNNTVDYAAIHEYGGTFTRYGRKAGDYSVTMPQRSFMRTSLKENKEKIVDDIKKAVYEGVKT